VRIALSRESAVKVFEDHQRRSISGSFLEQVKNKFVLLF
jgi:hypothetical protein